MTLKSTVKDGRGSNNLAGISNAGELVIKGFGDVKSNFQTLNSVVVGFNFFPPLAGQTFVMTTVIFDTGGPASDITVYEAANATTLTADKTLFLASIPANQFIIMALPFGGFLPITEGKFLNVKVSAQPVNITVMGFYKPVS